MPDKKAFKLYKSSLATKKYDVYVPNLDTGRLKKVSFGAKAYSDFTKHRDVSRRERYRDRHKNDNLDDPFSPGFWSWYVLWGNSPNLQTSFKSAVARAKRLL